MKRQACRQAAALAFALTALGAHAGEPDTETLIAEGEAALKAGKPAEAGLLFERILMDQPWRQGVWLDYALSLQQTGDYDSARAIYRTLLEKNPPDYLVPWLKQQASAAPLAPGGWRYAGALTMLSGHDSNLNHAQAASTLALTLPSGTQVLPLTRAAQAIGGTSQFVNLDWQAVKGGWMVEAGVDNRIAPGNSDQNYQQANLAASRSWIGSDGREYRGVMAVQNLEYGGVDIQRTMRGGLYQGADLQKDTACSASRGVEWQRFDYPTATELNGQYMGLAGEIGCRGEMDWVLMLSGGVNLGDGQRPGGNQKQVEIHGEVGGKAGRGNWLAVADVTKLRDNSGYSPLLDNNATRGVMQGFARLEYRYPLSAALQGIVSAEVFRQSSNLQLFALDGSAAWLGLRWLF